MLTHLLIGALALAEARSAPVIKKSNVLKLRGGVSAEQAQTAIGYITLAQAAVGYAFTKESMERVIALLRAYVRPWHGEVWIGKRDGHPSLASKHVSDYLADAQMHQHITAPGVGRLTPHLHSPRVHAR